MEAEVNSEMAYSIAGENQLLTQELHMYWT